MREVNRKTKVGGGCPYINLRYMANVCMPSHGFYGTYLIAIEPLNADVGKVSFFVFKDGMAEAEWVYLARDEFGKYITPIKDRK